jgi:hypothetical protein
MQINEITRPATRKEAHKILRNANYKRIGHGAFATVYQKHPYQILKLFNSEDSAYIEYLKMIIGSNNPHFPVIKGKPLQVNEKYYAVRMEPLTPFQKNLKSSMISNSVEEFIFSLKDGVQVPDANSTTFQHIKQYVPKFDVFVEACKMIVDLLKSNPALSTDLHSGNIMLRDNVIVFTDPIYSPIALGAVRARNSDSIHDYSLSPL